jgi:hypothetical protein
MEKQFSKFYPQKWVQITLLIGFCLVVYFLNLGQWDLWNPDEPRYAQVAREMIRVHASRIFHETPGSNHHPNPDCRKDLGFSL